ncbi:MAG: AMP-binding protein [Thermodesulfobacteriota bacterium]|jgi:acyl-CoA synthetase (AMP-forming)/AMP-acid ligase II
MGLRDYNIYNIIKRNARLYNNKIALISGDRRINHQRFLEKVNKLACGLQSVGLRKGDRIGILAQNSLEFIYLLGAAAKVGAIILPINWRLNPEEVAYIISDAAPKVFFVESEFQGMIMPMISKCDFIEKYYFLDNDKGVFTDFNILMQNDGICPPIDVYSDDSYLIIYTAAVQGRPRGAVLTHQNLIAGSSLQMYYWGLTKEDVCLIMLPLFHLAGLGMALSIVQAGGSNIILPKFDIDVALEHLQKDKVTIFGEFPPMLKTLLDKAEDGKYDLSNLKIVVGLVDPPETIKKLKEMTGATFWVGYGQTETSSMISFAPYHERPGSAGIPGYMVEVEIIDDYGNIMETGGAGEIVVRGPIVFKGYWNLEKDNEYTFRNGWHHTGDKGYFDSDGYLWYTGRTPAKELIKTGGENVYPVEVEKVILEHPLIKEVAVVGVPDLQWCEAIKAVCVLKTGGSLNESELIEFVQGRIARFKKPKYVVFVSSLPKTEDGCIDREKIKVDYGKV